MSEDLINRVADQLLNEINNWEEAGLDSDTIEVNINDWFEELKKICETKSLTY